MTSKEIKSKLKQLRADLIEKINGYLIDEKNVELTITKKVPIVFDTVDEQYDHIVCGIKTNCIVIDDNFQGDYYDVSFKDVNNDLLLKILEALEKKQFEVYEEESGQNS